jgi:hypothetical protein
MPEEELYDLQIDPHEVHNLAQSPAHQEVRLRLRSVLDKWIDETDDQGRTLEPEELVKSQGMTKKGANPQTGYRLENPPNERATPKSSDLGGKASR